MQDIVKELFGARELASEVVAKWIRPNDHVVCVAPSFSPSVDPSLLYVVSRLYPNAHCTVVDAMDSRQHVLEVDLKSKNLIFGAGNYAMYEAELRVLQQAGVSIEIPEFHFGLIQRLGLPEDSVDKIVDHRSAQFVVGNVRHPEENRVITWLDVLRGYYKTLKKNGSLLLFIDSSIGARVDYRDECKRAGFCLIQEIQIKDVWQIPISDASAQEIKLLTRKEPYAHYGFTIMGKEHNKIMQIAVDGHVMMAHPAKVIWIATK